MVKELRSVERVVPAMRVTEGGGFKVRRAFSTPNVDDRIDPFLLFDHFGPIDFAPGQASGLPDHPHDSRGHAGRMGPGDVQWMTAGSGIVHAEGYSVRTNPRS